MTSRMMLERDVMQRCSRRQDRNFGVANLKLKYFDEVLYARPNNGQKTIHLVTTYYFK